MSLPFACIAILTKKLRFTSLIKNINKLFGKVLQHKTLIQNFSYLSALQVFNMLVPLFTYPYLIRVLGKETYGLVIYAQVIASYLVILVNFGFNTYATKEISIQRNNKEKLNEIVNSIFILKGVFFFISLFILALIIQFLPEASNHKLLFILSMWLCLYDVIFPVWYFQGIEKMKYITLLTLISRSIFIILIFILIKKPEHYLWVPMIHGIGAITSGIIAIIFIYRKEKIIIVIPSFTKIVKYFMYSINFFISEISVKIFASSNKLIIGSFLGLTELAYYDLADRIVAIFRGIPLSIIRSTIYPRVAKTKDLNLLRKTTIIMSIYAFLAVILINVLAPFIISILGGKEMLPSLNIVRLFSIIIFTSHLSNYYITVGLWSFGYEKVFRNLMIYSSVIFLIIYGILWSLKIINIYTITLTPIIVDFYLILYIYIFWKNLKLKKNEKNV